MSKRRRGERQTHHQVPSLKSLAQHAVDLSSGRRTVRPRRMGDVDMAGGGGDSTGVQRTQRSAAAKGATEVGQGHLVTIPRNIPRGFNDNYTVTLTYADARTIPISMAGGFDNRTWALNGIFDPDITATGHQPLLRDLWASQYDYYAVLATRYRIEMYNCAKDPITWTAVGTSAQLVGGVTATIIPTTQTADITALGSGGPSPALEMKHTFTKALWPEHSIIFEGELTPGDFLVDAKDSDDVKTWTAVGANPTVVRYLGVSINSQTPAVLVGQNEQPYVAIQVVTTLEYDVQFTQMNQSIRSVPS
ncbi:MAG TPA: hypothetical protein VF297_32755 [Pyrinomonadaceae bacterium]